ncbi:MAG: alpha/beta fold hydrolase [Candidatus Hodarchaeota archaeon]
MNVNEQENIIFIHGLESSGRGFKAQLLKKQIPGIITPTFIQSIPGKSYRILLKKRMNQLTEILRKKDLWTLIGSSFGGLMAVLYTCRNPSKVKRLILFAPFLATPVLNPKNFSNIPLDVPVFIYHAKYDKIVSMKKARERAEQLFSNITFQIVENDNHHLQSTVKSINWKEFI